MKQIEVQIMGQSYMLGCPEGSDAQMMSAVGMVDEAMCKIRDGAKIKARERIAVLAALNLAFDQASEATYSPSAPIQNSSTNSQEFESVSNHELDLDVLIHKLDAALADDGRLF